MFIPVPDAARSDVECWDFFATTYYAAVQAFCDVTVVNGPDLLDILRTQLAALEPALPDPSQHTSKLPGIRGSCCGRELRGKFKYGGNVDSEHRAAVADRLAERASPGDAAARTQLLRRQTRTVRGE